MQEKFINWGIAPNVSAKMALSIVQTFVLLVEIFGALYVDKKFAFWYFLVVLLTLIMFGILV